MKKSTEKSGSKYIKVLNLIKKNMAGMLVIAAVSLTFRPLHAEPQLPYVTDSKDGTPISYEIIGTGDPCLVFVHGWSCDSRYWRAQTSHFSKKHRVVTLDLAGHGHSGTTRSKYTMLSFGEDVKAAADASGSTSIILIGHSMGGSVIAEAARLMPQKVIGLIGVDTLENIEYPLTQKEFEQMTAPFKKDFRNAARQFVSQMILPSTDSKIRDWILSDMSAAPPSAALSAMTEMMSQYITGSLAEIFDEIHVPVVTVNGDLWPVNFEANRRHMSSFDAIVIKNADHFLMINRPHEFNKALEEAVEMILKKKNRSQIP
ncbi:MAG: alpha/beta fold hydrolase [Desulfobacteraceae bacterium]|jgi:pimeloyl-ACP methyl ester carboxylesterase